eukprot:TRINITY_DN4804_c0_g3_i2.p1 TRINITY_DN4804_c0_g3~~TRINITY_DN4804_c0_g3_i2.p1  ORF type:complete len:596 (-),score=109.17 TRINITY_DN4804_c0_g3_i2:80-1867(-)
MEVVVNCLNPSSLSGLHSVGKLEILLLVLEGLESWSPHHPTRPNMVFTLSWILDFIVHCFGDILANSTLKKIYNVLCKYCVSEWEIEGFSTEIENFILKCFCHPHSLCKYLGVELWAFILKMTLDNELLSRFLQIFTELILPFNAIPYSSSEVFELPRELCISLGRVIGTLPQAHKEYVYYTLVGQDSPPSLLGKSSSALFFSYINPSCLGQNLLPDITIEIITNSLPKINDFLQGNFALEALVPYICCVRGLVGKSEVNEHVTNTHRNKLIQLSLVLLERKDVQANINLLVEIIDLLGVFTRFLSLQNLSKTLVLLLQLINSTPTVRVAVADFIGKLIIFDIVEAHNSPAAVAMFKLISDIFFALFSDSDWIVLSFTLHNFLIFTKFTKFTEVFTGSMPAPQHRKQLIQDYFSNCIANNLQFGELDILKYQANVLENHTNEELQRRKRLKLENTPAETNTIDVDMDQNYNNNNNTKNNNNNYMNTNTSSHGNSNNNNVNNHNHSHTTNDSLNSNSNFNNNAHAPIQRTHSNPSSISNNEKLSARRGLQLISEGLDCLKEVAQWNLYDVHQHRDEIARLGKKFFKLEDILKQSKM